MADRTSPAFDFVTTPTENWLLENLKACRSRFLIASPYVNEALTQVLREAPTSVKTTLVTKTDLRDFAIGSSSLDTLVTLASQGVRVMSLTGLHAKVYVLDRRRALVTSANATWSGLRGNWECGIAIYELSAVGRVARLVMSGFGSDIPPKEFSAIALSQMRRHVEALRSSIPRTPQVKALETPEALREAPFYLMDDGEFVNSFSGWTGLTLDFVLSLPEDVFTLSEVYIRFTPIAERRYPRNRHIHEKIRQQLQRLCALGLVERLEDGVYRRTIGR